MAEIYARLRLRHKKGQARALHLGLNGAGNTNKGKVLVCKTIELQQDYSGNEFKRMPDDSTPVKSRRDSEQKRWVLAIKSGMGIK